MKLAKHRSALAATIFIATVSSVQAASLAVSSSSFADGKAIPVRFAGMGDACGNGQGLNPQISWTNPPPGTRSIALVLFDPDGGKGLGAAHLVAYNIEPARGEIREGELKPDMRDFTVGRNMTGAASYRGLCPPAGDNPHHYVATIIASDLAPGSLAEGLNYHQLLTELDGHTLAGQSIAGVYGH